MALLCVTENVLPHIPLDMSCHGIYSYIPTVMSCHRIHSSPLVSLNTFYSFLMWKKDEHFSILESSFLIKALKKAGNFALLPPLPRCPRARDWLITMDQNSRPSPPAFGLDLMLHPGRESDRLLISFVNMFLSVLLGNSARFLSAWWLDTLYL